MEMTRYESIKSDKRSGLGIFRAIKRHSEPQVGEYTFWYDRSFGAVAEGEFVMVPPEVVSDRPAFTIWPNVGGPLKIHLLWDGEYPLKALDSNNIPWEVNADDIYSIGIVTDGYVISQCVNKFLVFSVIEREDEERSLSRLFAYGGEIRVYNNFPFGGWLEGLKPDVKGWITSAKRSRATEYGKTYDEEFEYTKIEIPDPRRRIFGPRKDYDEGWVDNIQRVY